MAGRPFGIVLAVLVVIFSLFWMVTVASLGAPWFFSLFGLVFVILAIYLLLRTVFRARRRVVHSRER